VELFDCVEDVQFWIKDRAGRYLAMNRACLLADDLSNQGWSGGGVAWVCALQLGGTRKRC
jgi:hypothetical protein